jgi:hypothetical protein
MTSRLKDTSITLQFGSASICSGGNARIVFPSIIFAEEEQAPTENLSTDSRFEVVSVEVQLIPADEARRGSFGHAVDIDEAEPKAGPIPVGLSLALPPANFEELAKRVTEIKARPIDLVVDISEEDEVTRVVLDGKAIDIVPRSHVNSNVQPMQPSSGVG